MPTSLPIHPLFDRTPDEIETREELDQDLTTGTIAGLTVQGLRLDTDWPQALSTADVTETLFVGCHLPSAEISADLVRRGAHVIPAFAELPYPTQPSRLYTPEDLAQGFTEAAVGDMYDAVVYRHFVEGGGALPTVREALAQRMHDHGIDDALGDEVTAWQADHQGPIVGIMGGHAERRGSPCYQAAAVIGRGLARNGCLIVTGGGPGVMEAANLGAYHCDLDQSRLASAIQTLAQAPDFSDPGPYTAAALAVRAATPPPAGDSGPDAGDWARRGGLAIPTWLYGHEPANLFAARIAKYFSNAIREDIILRISRGGIIFAPGRAGTVQEVFQAATKSFYATDGDSGPFVFLNRDYWRTTLPVESLLRPTLAQSPHGDLSRLIHVTDSPEEAVEIILDHARARTGPEGS